MMKSIKTLLVSSLLVGRLWGQEPLNSVDFVDLDRYLGLWYEIASYPNYFQKGCTATTAEYTKDQNDKIKVLNSCRLDNPQGKLKTARASGWVVDKQSFAKLKVSFFWPFSADYWIIELDSKDYQFAVVGQPSRKYLWILSRSATLDDSIYLDLTQKLRNDHGYDPDKLVKTIH
jgi:apolipoprotein D and lipocalin family protein